MIDHGHCYGQVKIHFADLVHFIFASTCVHLSGYEFARLHRRPLQDEIALDPHADELLFAGFAACSSSKTAIP